MGLAATSCGPRLSEVRACHQWGRTTTSTFGGSGAFWALKRQLTEISSSVLTVAKPLVKLMPGRERRGDKGLQRRWSNRHSPVIWTAAQGVSRAAGIAQRDYGMGQAGGKCSGTLLWCPWCYFLRLDGYTGQQREIRRVSNAQQVGLSPGF